VSPAARLEPANKHLRRLDEEGYAGAKAGWLVFFNALADSLAQA
jgi:hypothetical protein